MNDMTKLSFNAVPRTMTALNLTTDHTGVSNTDILNRAVQAYAGLTRMSLWQAFRALLIERAAVRRLANSLVKCETCGDSVLPRHLGEHARARHGDS